MITEKLGKAIRDLRRRVGLTQVELAARIGVAPATIYRYEAGTTPALGPLFSLYNVAEEYSLGALSNIFRSALDKRRFVTIAKVPRELAQDVPPSSKPRLVAQEIADQLVSLKDQDLCLVLALTYFIKENQNAAVEDLIRYILREWIDAAEMQFSASDEDDQKRLDDLTE